MAVFIVKNGQKEGPYSDSEIIEMIGSGTLTRTELCWRQGMADWQPLWDFYPPPPPGSAPPPTPSAIRLRNRRPQLRTVLVAGAIVGLVILSAGLFLRGGRASLQKLGSFTPKAVPTSTSKAMVAPGESKTAIPSGFSIPAFTLSPDRRYGVTAPDLDHYIEPTAAQTKGAPQNQVVEVSTGRVLVLIQSVSGFVDRAAHMNHGGINPTRWSKDSSLLLWEIEGKWSPRALVLIKLQDGTVKWQTNLLEIAQQEALTHTRKAAPEKYSAEKANAGSSGFLDGFTINVRVAGEKGDPDKGVKGDPIFPLCRRGAATTM
jgi:hypothetical protein